MNKSKIVGVYAQGKGDFGFIDIPGQKKGYFVHGKNKKNVLPGDTVEGVVQIFKGREEAVITNVVERKEALIVGEYQTPRLFRKFSSQNVQKKKSNFGFVVSHNPYMRTDIFIAGTNSLESKNGDIVGVKIIDWKKKKPEGKIVKKLGKKGDVGIEVLTILLEGGARFEFGDGIQKELSTIISKIHVQDFPQRKDFTPLFTFTIDGPDAKDLDDGISIQKKINGEYSLFVHIADVSHYIGESSFLDKEAYQRGTSIYTADRVIPMLPEKISNDVCSLNPHTNKLTLTCEMVFSKHGLLQETFLYEGIIKSDFRLTYAEVDAIIQNKKKIGTPLLFGGKVTSLLIESLHNAYELEQKISNMRRENGVLDFDFPETKIIFDTDGRVEGIQKYPKYQSNKLIEHFMVSANEAVSKKLSSFPFLYRIHGEPNEQDISKLQSILNLFEVKHTLSCINTKDFSRLLSKIALFPPNKKLFLEKMILRTLCKAEYSHQNIGHFGLGLQFYSHFTSPIRRYPDLQIHRIIKENLHGRLTKDRVSHYANILEKVARHTSAKERSAERLEYKVRDYFVIQFYKDKVGESFEGVITTVLNSGFFVGLEDTTEGFVELENYVFDEELQELKNIYSGKKYRLGESVMVRLIEADEIRLRLTFECV